MVAWHEDNKCTISVHLLVRMVTTVVGQCIADIGDNAVARGGRRGGTWRLSLLRHGLVLCFIVPYIVFYAKV